jgi:hypothetical protein
VVHFLKGLNDHYAHVRSNIMLMRPLPDIDTIFSMLCQQERQIRLPAQEPKLIATVCDFNKIKGKGLGFSKAPQQSFVCSCDILRNMVSRNMVILKGMQL